MHPLVSLLIVVIIVLLIIYIVKNKDDILAKLGWNSKSKPKPSPTPTPMPAPTPSPPIPDLAPAPTPLPPVPAPTPAPEPSPRDPLEDYTAHANRDSPGNDIGQWNQPGNFGDTGGPKDVASCARRCTSTPDCKAFAWKSDLNGGYCTMKSVVNKPLKRWNGTFYERK